MKFKSGDRLFMCLIIATVPYLDSSVESDLDCTEREVQLVGGQSRFEGRVEVCQGGVWKTVCDRGWHGEEATVVCRQLNYSDPSNASSVRRGCTGKGSGDQGIIKARWMCSGDELMLLDCPKEESTSICDHRRDAGVYCSGQTQDNCEEDNLRLVDGPNNASGRVEVCRFGCWGTVCDEEWDRDDAIIACRQLGFEAEQPIPTRGGYFGNVYSNRPIHLSQTKCVKDDDKLISCSMFDLNECTHSQDAGVFCNGSSICRDGEIRLIGGDSNRGGHVEMCYNGVWGAVCADSWNETAASIVCNQLGYTDSKGTFADFGWENSPVMFNNIACNETHSTLLQCFDSDNIGVYDCGRNNTAEVICELPNPDNITTLLPVTTLQTTDLMSSAVPKVSQSVVLGVVGGLLAAGVITVISVASVIIMVVVIRKQQRITYTFEKDSAMDNPTYDEGCQGMSTLNNLTLNNEYEKEFKNPIYSDEKIVAGHNSTGNTTNSQNIPHYEGVYTESTTVNETLYESADNGIVQGAHTNGASSHAANDGVIMKGTTTEGVYELPPNLNGVTTDDENCYSTLNPMYSQLEPHIGVPKPRVEKNYPPNALATMTIYSHLEYK